MSRTMQVVIGSSANSRRETASSTGRRLPSRRRTSISRAAPLAQGRPVSVAQDEIRERHADRLLQGVPEHPLRGRVPEENPVGGVEDDDRVRGRLDQLPVPGLGLAEEPGEHHLDRDVAARRPALEDQERDEDVARPDVLAGANGPVERAAEDHDDGRGEEPEPEDRQPDGVPEEEVLVPLPVEHEVEGRREQKRLDGGGQDEVADSRRPRAGGKEDRGQRQDGGGDDAGHDEDDGGVDRRGHGRAPLRSLLPPADEGGQRTGQLENGPDTGAEVEDRDGQIGRVRLEPRQPGGDAAQAEDEHPRTHQQDADGAAPPERDERDVRDVQGDQAEKGRVQEQERDGIGEGGRAAERDRERRRRRYRTG